MLHKMFLAVVVAVALAVFAVGGLAAAPLDDAISAPPVDSVVMGTLGAELTAQTYQTTTIPELDTEAILDGVNQGVGYGFTFANAFMPLIIILVGFAVAGGVLGLLVKLGPKIASMIKSAF